MYYCGSLGLPCGLYKDKRDRDLADLVSRIVDNEGSLIVMGDMNMSDRQEQYCLITDHLKDVYTERGWGLGFTRTNYPQTGLPTWRIDYIFYSPNMAGISAEIGDYAGSDHKPVVARIGFPRES